MFRVLLIFKGYKWLILYLFFFSPRPKAVTPPYFSDGVVNKGLEGVSDDITKAGIYTTNTSGINGGMNGHIPSSSHPNSGENYASSFALRSHKREQILKNDNKNSLLFCFGHLSCHFFFFFSEWFFISYFFLFLLFLHAMYHLLAVIGSRDKMLLFVFSSQSKGLLELWVVENSVILHYSTIT